MTTMDADRDILRAAEPEGALGELIERVYYQVCIQW